MVLIGEFFGISKHLEVLIIIVIGFGILIFDSSLFHLKTNLEQIWAISLDIRVYPIMHQIYLKYILSGVVLARTFTLHIFLALYVVMLWPAIFEDRYNLLLPWLAIGVIRCLLANFITLVTGCYMCFTHEGLKPVCGDYIVAQLIDHGPSVYAWFSVLSFYRELKKNWKEYVIKQNEIENQQMIRRRKARSMSIHFNFNEKADDGRNLISESTIGNLIHHLQNTVITKSRSLDTLLTQQAAEEEKEEIMNTFEDVPEDENKNIYERAKHLLNIVPDDISRAQREKSGRTLNILSDITLDALSFVGTSRFLSRVSSASFFVKNGIAYRSKNIKMKQSKRVKPASFYDCIEEEGKDNLNSNRSESELVNMFLDTGEKKK